MGPRIAFCQGCSDWKAGGCIGWRCTRGFGGRAHLGLDALLETGFLDQRRGERGVLPSCRGNEHPRGLDGCSGWTARRYARCCRSRCRRGIAASKPPPAAEAGSVHGDHRSDCGRPIGRATASNGDTAKRIFDRLRDEYGRNDTGGLHHREGLRFVSTGLRSREVFVPLSHSPGHAQADFGEAMAVIGGALRKIHFLAWIDRPHSDGCFVAAYPAETTEAFCDGHNAAFGGAHGPSSAASPAPSCTTTPSWRLPASWAMGSGSERASSRSFSPTICSRTGSAGRARATTRARSRDWSASSGGTSWSPSRVPRASRPSTMLSPNSAAGARRRGCGATRRPSASVSSGIVKFS